MDRLFGWLRIAGHRGWQLGGVAVGAFVLWTGFKVFQVVVVTAFVGLLLAALLVPVARWLERRGVPATAAAALTVVGGTLLLLGVLTLVTMQFVNEVSRLTQEVNQVKREVTQWLRQGPFDVTQQQLSNAIDQAIQAIQTSWTTIAGQAFAALKVVGGFVTALVLAFFLIRDGDQISEWILDRLVADEQRDLVRAAADRSVATLQGYIQATVLIGALDAALIGAALLLLGVPLALPLAVLTFFGGFFPVVGATVAGFVAILVATVSGGLVEGLIVLAAVIVVQQVDGNILQPAIMGRAVHLHPIVVLGALGAGAVAAGIVGAFLAVPMTAVLAAIGNEVRERRGLQAVRAEAADRSSEPASASPSG